MKLPDFVNQSSVDLQNRVSGFFGNEVKQDNLITSIDDLYKNTKILHDNVVVIEGEVEKDAAQVSEDRVVVEELSTRVFEADRATGIARDETLAARDETVQAVNTAITSANSASSDAAKAKLSEEAANRFSHDAQGFANNALISEEEAKKSFDLTYAIYEDLKKGQVYRGLWNPHTAAYPDNGGTNSVWDVVLNESEIEHNWNGIKWFWGDRLVYVKDANEYQQLESGLSGGVVSVNGKKGAVSLTASDVGALNKAGDTMTGNFGLNTNSLTGANNSVIIRDYNNGNVTLSGGLKADGTAGDLYIGHNSAVSGTAGANTRNVQLRAPMLWGATNTSIVDTAGINSEFFKGPIRTEKDANNVYHTVVGGTDTVNRGRTIIAGGECGKHIADNIATGSEQVHIGGDQNNGVYVHTGLQSGWGTDTHKIAKFESGELYLGKGTSRVYHQGYKPTAADVGVTNVGMGGGAVNINDVGITDLNKIKTSGHYYTSNTSDLNRPSSAAGPVVHVQGAAGYQQYVRDNSFMFRGFTGTTFQPWQTVYHTGYKPTAVDVGALPITGGRIIGTFEVAPAQGTNGINLLQTPNTGTNAIGVHGFTPNGSAIQWGSGVYYSGGVAQYAYHGWGTQPWVNGLKITSDSVYSNGLLGTEAGPIVANNGRFLCNSPNYPMFEMHIPGKVANAIYTEANENMILCKSNGSGANAATYATINATVAEFSGKVQSRTVNRSWGSMGTSGLYVIPTNNAGNGVLESCVSMRSFFPGVYESEAMFGTYHGGDWNNTSMVLSNYNRSTGVNMAWYFRNNGTFEKQGGFAITNDGNIKGSVYGGDWLTNWLARNYAPASDVNLKKIVGESKVDALGQVAKMKFHAYVWENEGFAKGTVKLNRLGVIAQEMEAIDPNYTRDVPTHNADGEEESIKVLDTANLLAVALKAIQELTERVATLEAEKAV